MTRAIDFIFDMMSVLYTTLNSAQFDLFGYRVGIGSIIFAFVVISIVCSVFWKGARG